MPVLDDVRKTKEVILPKSNGKVVIYDDVLYGDTITMVKTEDETEKQLVILQAIIKSWDFTDQEGKGLDVTAENIKKLPMEDVTAILSGLNEAKDKKKET